MDIQPFVPEEFTRTAEEERMKREFQDYLILKELAGNNRGVPTGARVASSLVNTTSTVVEIATPEFHEEHDSGSSTVVLHKNEHGEITQIEILCSCGKKNVVHLEYTDNELSESHDEALTHKAEYEPDAELIHASQHNTVLHNEVNEEHM